MRGDLMYIFVITLEDKRVHITASSRGFYVNQTTEEIFNPKPVAQAHLSHSLVDLLSQISPGFKKNFAQLQKKRTQRHPYERVATPYQVYSWMSPNMEHTIDAIRAEDAFSSKLGYEEHIPGNEFYVKLIEKRFAKLLDCSNIIRQTTNFDLFREIKCIAM